MEWDLGLEGLAVLAAMSLGFGLLAGVLVGGSAAHRLLGVAITTVACCGVGLLVSEWMFGWATEEELQPNIDGLSRDEALLSGVLATVIVVLVMRRVARRSDAEHSPEGTRAVGRHSARHRA
jgi:hypothetical protein